METIVSIGRRKSAVARIYVRDGKGVIIINDRDYASYFPTEQLQTVAKQPLVLIDAANKYDITVNLKGGGMTGQAEALRLAIARAIVKIDAEKKPQLKANGYLTRDSREVERKKPGQPGARKRFQFSKR
jgi:small subunit ribosomal protein S9